MKKLAEFSTGHDGAMNHVAETLTLDATGGLKLRGRSGCLGPWSEEGWKGERMGGEGERELTEREAVEWCISRMIDPRTIAELRAAASRAEEGHHPAGTHQDAQQAARQMAAYVAANGADSESLEAAAATWKAARRQATQADRLAMALIANTAAMTGQHGEGCTVARALARAAIQKDAPGWLAMFDELTGAQYKARTASPAELREAMMQTALQPTRPLVTWPR